MCLYVRLLSEQLNRSIRIRVALIRNLVSGTEVRVRRNHVFILDADPLPVWYKHLLEGETVTFEDIV
jgi:hypothetical protein